MSNFRLKRFFKIGSYLRVLLYYIIISRFECIEFFLALHFEEMGIIGDRRVSTLLC